MSAIRVNPLDDPRQHVVKARLRLNAVVVVVVVLVIADPLTLELLGAHGNYGSKLGLLVPIVGIAALRYRNHIRIPLVPVLFAFFLVAFECFFSLSGFWLGGTLFQRMLMLVSAVILGVLMPTAPSGAWRFAGAAVVVLAYLQLLAQAHFNLGTLIKLSGDVKVEIWGRLHPNFLASLGTTGFLFFLYGTNRDRNQIQARWMAGATFVLALACRSRGTIAALLVWIVWSMALASKRFRGGSAWFPTIIALVGSAVVITQLGDDQLKGRSLLWQEAVRIFRTDPFQGVGLERANQIKLSSTDIESWLARTSGGFHSSYLQTLVCYGTIGLLLLALTLIPAVRQAIHRRLNGSPLDPFAALIMINLVRGISESDSWLVPVGTSSSVVTMWVLWTHDQLRQNQQRVQDRRLESSSPKPSAGASRVGAR